MRNIRSRIAVAATVLALGGLAGLALSADRQKAPSTVATDPLVRTKVIHRTIHITRHAKPRNPAAASAPPAPETSPVAASSYSAEAPSATTSTSGAGSYSEAAPVTTATSGGGGGYASESGEDGGEVEHEGGGADD